jgi:hypothetical protein
MPSEETTTKATEESTYIVNCAFTDDEGNDVTPDTMAWSLTDRDGTVINSREDVAIAALDTNVDIVLSGDDLTIPTGYTEIERYLVLEGTYSGTAGSGLPFRDQLKIWIEQLRKVA